MRKTKLNKTSIALVLILFAFSIIMSISRNSQQVSAGDSQVATGKELFNSKGCSNCHAVDSTKAKFGPSLEGLFNRDELPVSGQPVSEENVKDQFISPYESMPSFADRLSDKEMDTIISYLKTL